MNKTLKLFLEEKEQIQGFSSAEVAEKVGISNSFYCQIKSGKKKIPDRLMLNLISVLQMSEIESKEFTILYAKIIKRIEINFDNPLFNQIINILEAELE